MHHYKQASSSPRENSSFDEGLFLLQSLQSYQAGQYLQQQQQQGLANQIRCKKTTKVKKTVASIYEGQNFPFRLYHLLNNIYFDDVIHWSEDGNNIIIPSEADFVSKVLRRSVQRIFKTESMKSFVRQLNLYGFHKVSLEKDDAFAYLKLHAKAKWPDAVFNHSYFKKEHPELLEQVKRRCKVKENKEKQKNKLDANRIFDEFQIASANAYAQFFPSVDTKEVGYPNLLSPNETSNLGRKEIKRKLSFLEEKDVACKKNMDSIQFAHPSFHFYPQGLLRENTLPDFPHSGWPLTPINHVVNYPNFFNAKENFHLQQPALTVPFLRQLEPCGNSSPAQNIQNEERRQEVTPSQTSSESSSVANKAVLSPLDKFCAELFRPGSLDNTPSKNCKVGLEEGDNYLFVS